MSGCVRSCVVVLLLMSACATDDGVAIEDLTLPAEPLTLCDGSDDLVLAYRLDSYWSSNPVTWANGVNFLYVDGHCRYWVGGPDGEVLTGTLDNDRADQLTARTGLAHWSELDGDWNSFLADALDITLWHRSAFIHCLGCDAVPAYDLPAVLPPIAWALADEAVALRSAATPLDGPMRMAARYGTPPGPDPSGFLWTLEPSLADLAARYETGDCLPILIDDPAVIAALRQVRSRTGSAAAPVPMLDEAGTYYELYAADVIPFEVENLGIQLPR